MEVDANVTEISDHAVLHVEAAAGAEVNADAAADADSVERYAVDIDPVARACRDGDGRSVGWRRDVGPALALDGDGVADGEAAVGARVAPVPLAAPGARAP